MELKAACELVGEQSEIERTAVREELAGELCGLLRPRRGVISTARDDREALVCAARASRSMVGADLAKEVTCAG